jgi:hypothetical protein
MIPLSLDAPLSSLLDALITVGAGRGVRGLAKLRCGSEEPAAYKAAETRLQAARRAGPRIRLSTLAAYARAAGWRLRVDAAPAALREALASADADAQRRALEHGGYGARRELGYAAGLRLALALLGGGAGAADDLDVTVAQAARLAAAWGFELSVAVEPLTPA